MHCVLEVKRRIRGFLEEEEEEETAHNAHIVAVTSGKEHKKLP